MTSLQKAELTQYSKMDKNKYSFAILSAESYIAWWENMNGSMSQEDRNQAIVEHVRGFFDEVSQEVSQLDAT